MQDAHRAGKGFRGGKTRRRSFSHFMRESGGFILSERHVGGFIAAARLRLRRAVPGDRKSARRRCARRGVRGDKWRAHCASPRRTAARSVCAAALADEVQVFSFIQERKRSEKALRSFLPLIIASRRAQEASGTGLLGITAPRGAVPRLWTPTLPRVQPPFSMGSVVQWGIRRYHGRITGGHLQDEWL